MKLKKEYLILGIVIAALAGYLVLREADQSHYELPVQEKIQGGDLTKVRIKTPESTIVLNKKADNWVINTEEYPADAAKVKQIEGIIGELTLTALVSESKSYDRYDLADDKKISVQAWVGDTLRREFELGKSASSFKHTFVKLSGDHRVYHARGSFRFNFDETVDGFREKTVLDFDVKEIREISVAKNGKTEVYRRSEEANEGSEDQKQAGTGDSSPQSDKQPVWKRAGGEDMEIAEVNRFLTMLDGLDCDEYVYGSKKEAFKDPVYVLTLKGAKDYTLSIFQNPDKEDKSYPAVSSENAYPFKLTEYRGDDIMKTFDKKEEKKSET